MWISLVKISMRARKVYASQIEKYMQADGYTDANKMIVLSETGTLFDPDLAIRDGAMWGFFATWGGEFVSEILSLLAIRRNTQRKRCY